MSHENKPAAEVKKAPQKAQTPPRQKRRRSHALERPLPDLSYNSAVWDSAKSRRTSGGYIARYFYHPGLRKLFSKQEHILVWERVHNRETPRGWCIHHRDGDRTNNRAENLVAMPTVFHQELHAGLRLIEKEYSGIQLEVERHRLVESYIGKAEYFGEIWELVDMILPEMGLH